MKLRTRILVFTQPSGTKNFYPQYRSMFIWRDINILLYKTPDIAVFTNTFDSPRFVKSREDAQSIIELFVKDMSEKSSVGSAYISDAQIHHV